jgi:hypothetical protein
MGNDGGSIPRRHELVKNHARERTVSEMKATTQESLTHSWSHCHLTGEPLDLENAVSDWRGNLYNYESILQGLMPSDNPDEPSSQQSTLADLGIRSLRDIVKVIFTRYNPSGNKDYKIWACPISLKELGPATKSVYLVPCGHAFSEAAIREIHAIERNCPICAEPFHDHIITILPTTKSEIEFLTKRIEGLREQGTTHSLAKGKKKKKKAKESSDARTTNTRETAVGEKRKAHPDFAKTVKTESPMFSGNINNPMTASLTARVLAEQNEISKKRKLAAAASQ